MHQTGINGLSVEVYLNDVMGSKQPFAAQPFGILTNPPSVGVFLKDIKPSSVLFPESFYRRRIQKNVLESDEPAPDGPLG